MKRKSVYNVKRTPMQRFIIDRFHTYGDFAEAVGVSLPTARKWQEQPMTMTVSNFARICVAAECTAVELFEVIKTTEQGEATK